MSIAQATVTWKFNLPIAALPQKSLFQGADLARDPVTGIDYLFQGQAHTSAVDDNDTEDWSVHRYRMDGPNNPVYVDSMRITGAGHIQAHFVRITAASNPYVMIGMEIYDAAGNQVRKEVRRCLYRAGTFDKNHVNFKKVFTGPGLSTDVVGNNEDFTVVLRRGRTSTDEFEWYREADLLAHTSDTVYPKPAMELIVPKHSTTAQTWTSVRAYNHGQPRAFRFNGLATNPGVVFEFRDEGSGPIVTSCDVTNYRSPGVAETAFNEPEMLFFYENRLYFGKQFNGAGTNRILGFFSMSWSNP